MSEQTSLELRELEELYRNTPVGLCVVDRKLRFVRANEEYARTVGRSVDELLSLSMRDVIPNSARNGAVELASRVIETGEPILETELRRVISDQPELNRIWLVNVHPVFRDGSVAGAMAVLQNVTSMRQAEEAAEERLRELESIYGNSPVGLSSLDSELRYLRVNQMLADINGLSIEQMVGKTYREISPETADVAEPFLRKLIASGRPVRNLEVRAVPPGDPGVEHIFLLSLNPVRDASGGIAGHVSAIQDVTALRRVEEAAARRLAELEILYEHTPAGLCHFDANLRVLHVNSLFAELSELPRERQKGADAPELLPYAVSLRLLPQLRHVLQTGESSVPLEVDGKTAGPDGRECTWMAQTHPVCSDAGEVTGAITVLQDVSDQIRGRRTVEEVRDRLAEAQSVAKVGSWEWDLVDDVVWWSPELYAILGDEVAFTPTYDAFVEHVHPDDRSKLREQLQRTLEDDKPYHITFQIIRTDGAPRFMFAAARLERDEGGRAVRLVGTCQDVTEFSPLHGVFDFGGRP